MFTVDQTEQVLITQFGQPVRVITEPGLHTKTPFVQTVITFDKRLLNLELPGEQVILGDQRRLVVDSFTLFRIIDPLLYYQSVGPTEDGIRGRLNSIVSASLRRVLANNKLLDVLSAKRDQIMATIRDQVNAEMKGFGVAIEDVRIRRADLPDENTKAILSRMQSERQRVAAQARAEGAEASASASVPTPSASGPCCWPRRAPRPTSCAARARREAIRLYAKAYAQDVDFFASGAPCRPTGMRSKPAILAWCLPPTTISCAIFRPRRRPAAHKPVASRRAPDHIGAILQGTQTMRLIRLLPPVPPRWPSPWRSPCRWPDRADRAGLLPGRRPTVSRTWRRNCCRRW